MWTIYWNDKSIPADNVQKICEIIDKLNLEYVDKKPIIVRVENDSGDTMCICIGNKEGYSFMDYISCDGCTAKHIKGENVGDDIISFHMGEYESEFYIRDTIKYQTALKALRFFLLYNTLDTEIEWEDD